MVLTYTKRKKAAHDTSSVVPVYNNTSSHIHSTFRGIYSKMIGTLDPYVVLPDYMVRFNFEHFFRVRATYLVETLYDNVVCSVCMPVCFFSVAHVNVSLTLREQQSCW